MLSISMLASTRYLRHCTRRLLPACSRGGQGGGGEAGGEWRKGGGQAAEWRLLR